MSESDELGKAMGVHATSRRYGVRAAALLAFTAGCSSPAVPAPGPALSLPPGAVEVAALRGHAFRRDVRIEQVTRAKFRHVIADQVEAHPHLDEKGHAAFLKGFGFISPAADLSEEASVRLEASALVGLYVSAQRAIYVRPHTRASSAVDPDDVLHELGHALQDDVFGMDRMFSPSSEDERLAHQAVYEGDATVIAWGIAGQRAGRTAQDAIADRRTTALAESATLGVTQELEAIPGWSGVPRVTQVELFFPYSAGADLVAEAFLAGGPPLVDCMFEHLPTTTEQVLHTAKYFDGEGPVPVRAPGAPPGYELLATGTMGELRTRALLELGLPPDVAVGASVGWGGDAYAIVSNGAPGAPAVLWSTVWDDEEHAERFAAAMTREFPPGASPLGPVAILREGARVAWTRGLDDAGALRGLLMLPGTKPRDAPPCGQVILPSKQIASETLVPAGGDPHLTMPEVGLRALLPPRFASIRTADNDLTVQEIGQHGRGLVSHESKPFEPSSFEALTVHLAPVLAFALPLGKVELLDVALPIGPAKMARWPLADASGEATFIAAPLCNGKKTLYVTTAARSEEARVALAQWVRSIEPSAPGLPAMCSADGGSDKR